MSLGNDAGKVGEDGVGDDDEVRGKGVPDNEGSNHKHLYPMGKFSSAGFPLKLSEVIRIS